MMTITKPHLPELHDACPASLRTLRRADRCPPWSTTPMAAVAPSTHARRAPVNALGAIAGLLCVAALTPGPNNLVVLRTASRDGLRGALPAIAGVVLGGLALLCMMAVGAGTAFAAWPALRRWLGIAGAAYLLWLGAALVVDGLRANRSHVDVDAALPAGTLGLIGFQFLNPKSWVMVLTVIASVPADGLRGYLPLAALFVAIPTGCLLLWAALGALLARWLSRPRVRRGTDVGMGALLVASAGLLLLEP